MGEGIAIRLRSVTKRFPGSSTDAVGSLDLQLQEGTVTALVGPSGCGKTTTLKMINRLIEPTSGTIELFGRDIRSLPVHELRRGIGYVIQQAGLFPHLTVAGNIATVPRLLRWDKARVAQRVDELVDLVGLLPEILDRYPSQLSGGQQQRVGVARALAADPPVLLMDEPYSAVDPIVRARLQDELAALQRRVGKTIVLVTHDIEEAIKLADRIALLNVGGVLEQFGSPDELLRSPAGPFVERFLGRERSLRRLALLTAGAAPLEPVDPGDSGVELDGLPVVGARAPLREVLDALVTNPGDRVAVVDGDGRPLGTITMAGLRLVLDGAGLPEALEGQADEPAGTVPS
ncbi:MAG TPA: ABC transporter ATP-binding protein [Acidimicrobiales bacterium]|jgi:osmoprotectant transport system ATP-binding protein